MRVYMCASIYTHLLTFVICQFVLAVTFNNYNEYTFLFFLLFYFFTFHLNTIFESSCSFSNMETLLSF